MRVAVVGLGRMGRFYAQVLATMAPVVQLAAVADPDPSARGRMDGIPAFPEQEQLLRKTDIDAVIIATPASSHVNLVLAAADAGKAIFCEKPLALTVDSTRQALVATRNAGVLLQVGFMRRFDPAYTRAKQAIDDGRIGRPITFKAVGRDPGCQPVDYANPAHSGGLIVDMAVHDFDLARWLMSSEVEHVSADGALVLCNELQEVGDIDSAVINLRFASGALGNVEVSRTSRVGYDIRTEVVGSAGVVRVGGTSADDLSLITTTERPGERDATPHFIGRFADAYRLQIEHFVDCVRHQKPPLAGAADALAAMQIAHAANASLETGRAVTVDAEAQVVLPPTR
jgi:inositol 2-dehydrogenase